MVSLTGEVIGLPACWDPHRAALRRQCGLGLLCASCGLQSASVVANHCID